MGCSDGLKRIWLDARFETLLLIETPDDLANFAERAEAQVVVSG